MKILILVIIYAISTLIQAQDLNRLREEDRNKVNLPACAACSTLVHSFLGKAAKNGNFEDVILKTCSDVSRGTSQCQGNVRKWSQHLKNWFENDQQLDLKNWLCIDTLQVCCPENHYGQHCEPCNQVGGNGKICSGNGKCKGSGTRKGNGSCHCDPGFTGDACQECSISHYLSYQDAEKTLCSPCHHSCLGNNLE